MLAPNAAVAGRATLTLAEPLLRPCPVVVLDVLGRAVRQAVVPAGAGSLALSLTGLGPACA